VWGGTVLGWKNSPRRQSGISVNTGTERNDLFVKIQHVLMPRFVMFFGMQSLCSMGWPLPLSCACCSAGSAGGREGMMLAVQPFAVGLLWSPLSGLILLPLVQPPQRDTACSRPANRTVARSVSGGVALSQTRME